MKVDDQLGTDRGRGRPPVLSDSELVISTGPVSTPPERSAGSDEHPLARVLARENDGYPGLAH